MCRNVTSRGMDRRIAVRCLTRHALSVYLGKTRNQAERANFMTIRFQGTRGLTWPPMTSPSPSMPPSRWSVRCWSRASRAPARPSWHGRSRPRLGCVMIEWNIKSTTRRSRGFMNMTQCQRLRDSQLGEERVHDVKQLHQAGQALGSLRGGRARGPADRRDRQGRYRVSQRPSAGTRQDGVPCLRDRRDHPGRTARS